MKLEARILPSNNLRADADLILLAERLGFGAAWVAEEAHNPFFSLTIAAKETGEIQLGAQGAVAFPRSPMITAQIAWDLARQSEGRFRLGLDAQADAPAGIARLREYIESLRAIWHTFQSDERLRYRGEFYTFRLMAPFFNPGPINHPDIPIYLASLNPAFAGLAGALCQGLQVGAIHTADYLEYVLKPALAAGLGKAGRDGGDFSLTATVMIASGLDDAGIRRARHALKRRLLSAANTAAFHRLMAHHNWEIAADGMAPPALTVNEDALDSLIPEEIVEAVAIVAQPQDVIARITARYAGLADRVSLELSGENSALIEAIMAGR